MMWKSCSKGQGEHIVYEFTELVLSKKTKYHLLEIVKTKSFGYVLFLDGDPQSSEVDGFICNESLIHPSMMSHVNPEKIFIGGGGTCLTLREVLRHNTVKEVTLVDIDEELVSICKNFLKTYELFNDPRVTIVYDDAKKYLENNSSKYDCIFLDLTMPQYDNMSAPMHVRDFYQVVKDRLNPNGVFATLANSADFRYSNYFASVVRTLKDIFSIVCPYTTFIPLYGEEWAFVMASETYDPLVVKRQKIDNILSLMGNTKPLFYDWITHKKLFYIDKMLRDSFENEGSIMTDIEQLQDYNKSNNNLNYNEFIKKKLIKI